MKIVVLKRFVIGGRVVRIVTALPAPTVQGGFITVRDTPGLGVPPNAEAAAPHLS